MLHSMTTEFDRDAVVRQVSESLHLRFPHIPLEEIRDVVADEVGTLEGKPVHDYITVLSERAAKRRLLARA